MQCQNYAFIEADDDLWSTEAWSVLLNEAQQVAEKDTEHLKIAEIENARRIYERFLKQFPTSGKHWSLWIELEMKLKNHERVEKMFGECLSICLHVELFRLYIDYIKKTKEDQLVSAFEFALQSVGMDILSGPIWTDYLTFLKSLDINLQLDNLRRIYHKAISNPICGIENIWRDYDAFENGLNRLTAKKVLSEKSVAYMLARSAYREKRVLSDQVNRNLLPRPPRGTEKEEQQLYTWKNLIAWEKRNPLKLEDSALVQERVLFVYRQALMCLRFYPEIWYDMANYLTEHGRSKEAADFLAQGTEALPNSLILHFAYAEFEEGRKNFDTCKKIFESMLNQAQRRLEYLNRTKEELEENDGKKGSATKDLQNQAVGDDSNRLKDDVSIEERIQRILNKDRKVMKEDTKESLEYKSQEVMREETLVFVHYMRFARRTEGSKAMRNIFTRARKSTTCTYHVFLASALLEFTCHKEPNIGLNILRVGAQKFGDDPDYILHYIDYLASLNDDSNIRALLEKSLSSISSDKSRKLWNAFLDFETKYGDLGTIKSLEKRRSEAYPDEIFGFASLAERYKFMDLLPCKMRDLQIFGMKRHQKLAMPSSDASPTLNLLVGIRRKEFVKPDLSQLVAYSKKGGASGAVAGTLNSSLMPFKAILTNNSYATLSKLLQSLPSSQQFQGPYLPIDDLISLIKITTIPTLNNVSKTLPSAPHSLKSKRKGEIEDDTIEEQTSGTNKPPSLDIYRQRQQKRLQKPA